MDDPRVMVPGNRSVLRRRSAPDRSADFVPPGRGSGSRKAGRFALRAGWSIVLALLLGACSDQRAAFEIAGSGQHSLTLIRVQNFPWDKAARYSVVAARLPECQRRHDLGAGGADTKVEVYAPGNDAWILRQGRRMYVVETRTCEGFAKLDAEPEGGTGALQGSFQMRAGNFVFVSAPKGGDGSAAEAPAGR